MSWLDTFILRQAERINMRRQADEERDYKEARSMKMLAGAQVLSKASPEGEDRITFELTTAVGGKILNVRRYDPRTDRHDSQTYVVPNGENLSERIVKILDLESFK
jgi:hypothetical protein